MKWMIQDGVFSEQPELEKAILNNGGSVEHVLTNYLNKNPYTLSEDTSNEDKIGYGSIPFCRYMYNHTSWNIWTPPKTFDWSSYCYKFQPYQLLNSGYIMCPFGQSWNKAEQFFGHAYDSIFIKPNSGYKPFTGRTIDILDLDKELQLIKKEDTIFDDELCVISPSISIGKEYRFLVINNKIITGSQYLPVEQNIDDNDQVMRAAQKFVDGIHMDVPVWTIDICSDNAFLRVLEINSFSCAGLYDMNMDKVVKGIHEQVRSQE